MSSLFDMSEAEAANRLMRLAKEEGVEIVERKFTVEEALAADEAFLTSTTAPILPVVRIDGNAVGSGSTGPMVRRLAELVWNEVARQTGWRA